MNFSRKLRRWQRAAPAFLVTVIFAVLSCSNPNPYDYGPFNTLGGNCTVNHYPNVTITITESQIPGYSNVDIQANSAVIEFYNSQNQPVDENEGGNVSFNMANEDYEDSGTLTFPVQQIGFGEDSSYTYTGTVTGITANPSYEPPVIGSATPNVYCAVAVNGS